MRKLKHVHNAREPDRMNALVLGAYQEDQQRDQNHHIFTNAKRNRAIRLFVVH